jgi:hypothetical protein
VPRAAENGLDVPACFNPARVSPAPKQGEKPMHCKMSILICDEDHFLAQPVLPDFDTMTNDEIARLAVNPLNINDLRRAAKKAGWRRINGLDYCPGCAASMAEDSE